MGKFEKQMACENVALAAQRKWDSSVGGGGGKKFKQGVLDAQHSPGSAVSGQPFLCCAVSEITSWLWQSSRDLRAQNLLESRVSENHIKQFIPSCRYNWGNGLQ